MPVTEINSLEEFKTFTNKENFVIVNFYSPNSDESREINPKFEQLSERCDGVEFYKVNVDERLEIFEAEGLPSVPIFIKFLNGRKFDAAMGTHLEALE
ncbi:hypothetical protein FRC00_005574, partial [Tulasnella sp. 408]